MYIWVILATFLAMLASYSLSVRPDMREITVVPVAEATLGKFMAQHKAAKKYAIYHRGINNCTKEGEEEKHYLCYDNNIMFNGYGEIALENYLEFGQELDGRYKTQIFCLNIQLNTIVQCASSDVRRFVVTYGEIPERWQNSNSETFQPVSDFLNAMRNMTDAGEEFGYMVKATNEEINDTENNPSGSDFRLVGRMGNEIIFVPSAILGQSDFRSSCIDEDGTNAKCIVYISGA